MVEPIMRTPLSNQVYAAIRERLVDEKISAGDVLCISDLAEQLNVSTTPIREALSRLQSEGLVDLPHGKQPVVRELSDNELKSLYEIRMLLEPYLMRLLSRLAADHAEVRDGLASLLGELREALDSGLTDTRLPRIKVDYRLGEILLSVSDNLLLGALINLVNNHILRLRLSSARSSDELRQSNLRAVTNEHCQLIEAVLAGDEETISRTVAKHLERSLERSGLAMRDPS